MYSVVDKTGKIKTQAGFPNKASAKAVRNDLCIKHSHPSIPMDDVLINIVAGNGRFKVTKTTV
jgi:hypothetical protein